MAGILSAEDFTLEVFGPPGGRAQVRIVHRPTGRRWQAVGEAGQAREAVQEAVFAEAYRDLQAAGWTLPEPGPDAEG